MEKASSLIKAEETLDSLLGEGSDGVYPDDAYPDDAYPDDAYPDGVYPDGADAPAARLGAEHSRSSGPGGKHVSGILPSVQRSSGVSHSVAVRGDPGRSPSRSANPVESGVFSGVSSPVSGERLVESLQTALSAASRNEAGLGSMQRSIRDSSRALTASRHAQEALTEELRVMYRGLNELMSEKAGVERYAALLTQERDAALDAAEEARREAKRDREFLLREQDRFIQLLLEEHEAELQQLRRGLAQRAAASAIDLSAAAANTVAQSLPATSPGLAPPPEPLPPRAIDERKATLPPGPEPEDAGSPRVSGAALARLALANTGASDWLKPVPLHSDEKAEMGAVEGSGETAADKGPVDTQRSGVSPAEDEKPAERAPTYPPAPAVLDLDSLAAEVDGNSERPPPIRRIGVMESKLHLKPARIPSQLFDTLVSQTGEVDPNRKN